ncbi:hypothetical protein [Mariniblastus fucicola]|uniref:hypothetical protein n=1 Tax=Mariniblastus fucicola TaxID=980251 RepID=UPI00192E71AE|nr:hypothetical protein [Mariniblastus fucicola]
MSVLFGILAIAVLTDATTLAQTDRNSPPINYESTKPDDNVARLAEKLANSEVELQWDEKHGWLPSFLEALDIPSTSQTLVFSKTSQQNRKIRPSSPRAIYFNDNVYLGFVQQGDFLEIAAVDPKQGAIFYTVDQHNSKQPMIARSSEQCMSCHESHKTQDVPGFLVRSVYPKKSGHPDFRLGTEHTDHTTPLQNRFGGWYVTGHHGGMRHRGNVFVDESQEGNLDRESGANLNRLPSVARPELHLEPTSDIVALMLLEHQTQFHNFVTQASWTARQALHQQATMNELFERTADYRSDTTQRRLDSAASELVEYLFFANEFKLTSPVKGRSEFAESFMSKGVRCSQGRSLRDLDLQTRMLRYPCSYLVYTESFNALPKPILEIVKVKMLAVLREENDSETFAHLGARDRKAILEILGETHPLFRD